MKQLTEILQKLNIKILPGLEKGIVDKMEFDPNNSVFNIYITFPEVIDFHLRKALFSELREKIQVMYHLDTSLNISFIDKRVNEEQLKDYYKELLYSFVRRHQKYSILEAYTNKIENSKITFYVRNESGIQDINLVLGGFREGFEKMGLDIQMDVQISTFAEDIKEKLEQKRLDNQRKAIKEIKSSTKTIKKEEKNITYKAKFQKNRTHLNEKAVALSTLPATESELIDSQQKGFSDSYVVQGVLSKVSTRKGISRRTNQEYELFEGILTDDTGAIQITTFLSSTNEKQNNFYRHSAKKGEKIKVYGRCEYNNFKKDISMKIIEAQIVISEEENYEFAQKFIPRIELHAHSKMTVQDSILDIKEYVKEAANRGYKALALTDYENIQGLPDFYNECKTYNIKPILGLEAAYINNDKVKIVYDSKDLDLATSTYVVFDIETTGLSARFDDIIEIAGVKIKNGNVIAEFDEYVKPGISIDNFITELTSITNDDVRDADGIGVVLPKFMEFCEGSILVAHNASFDSCHIYENLKRLGFNYQRQPVIDTLLLAKVLYEGKIKKFGLGVLSKFLGVQLINHHRAIFDAKATGDCFTIMLSKLLDNGIMNLNDVNSIVNEDLIHRYAFPKNISILCKNEIGKKNLYRLISLSHTKNFFKSAIITKKDIINNRDGLFISSGTAESDLFEIALNRGLDELNEVIKFYDYIEIHPLQIYYSKIKKGNHQRQMENIESALKDLVRIAKENDKMIVATGDVHYLKSGDAQYRDIYIQAPRIGGVRHPLVDSEVIGDYHFRTTKEMQEELSFLGEDVSKYVIDNPKKINDEIEEFPLFPRKLFAPEDDFLSDRGVPSIKEETKRMTFQRARELYGREILPYIENRINIELNSIIGNSFAPIYYIAYMLVNYSKEANYVVGSRGSVGSSLVAYLMGITEVNPLPPHYYCSDCGFVAMKETEEEKQKYPLDPNQAKLDKHLQKFGTGYDLPKKKCPHCGKDLSQSGVDIPFATFLGFSGDKIPDIDLNFSGLFQPQAHEFCRDIFGEERAFRAGTIGTIAAKSAFGYVKGYCEKKNHVIRRAEQENLVEKIAGVKKTTGQHPGGIVVVPRDIEYTEITPVQFPANDITSSWRTTHYDYHKFEKNLLKLDILGHDDPTMIRHLMDFVSKYPNEFPFDNVEDIPLSDKGVFAIFNGLTSLDLTPAQTFGQVIGTTGIPEFGTSLTKDMLSEIKPTSVESLLKISGLSHGTDVWNGNARDFMLGNKKGFPVVDFEDLIGCRDDIMMYLIKKGMKPIDAFAIMERVRKGRGLTFDMEDNMKKHMVPAWYIESCKLIKYMFPKAHATAYVIMALRIGWFKVHKPIYYYAAYFSRRAGEFDVESMVNGFEAVQDRLTIIRSNIEAKKASNKEISLFTTLLLAIEMISRGYSFKQMDINESDALHFKVSHNKKSLLIPFVALDSLGVATAESIVNARNNSSFTSKSDVKKRTKINSTQFEKMTQLGVFKDLEEKDQIKLF